MPSATRARPAAPRVNNPPPTNGNLTRIAPPDMPGMIESATGRITGITSTLHQVATEAERHVSRLAGSDAVLAARPAQADENGDNVGRDIPDGHAPALHTQISELEAVAYRLSNLVSAFSQL